METKKIANKLWCFISKFEVCVCVCVFTVFRWKHNLLFLSQFLLLFCCGLKPYLQMYSKQQRMGNYTTISSPPFYLVSCSTGLVADLEHSSTNAGTKVVLAPKVTNSKTQLWWIFYTSSKSHTEIWKKIQTSNRKWNLMIVSFLMVQEVEEQCYNWKFKHTSTSSWLESE